MTDEKPMSQGYLKETTSTLRKKQENLALLKELTEKETSRPPVMRFGSASPSASPVPEGGVEHKEGTAEEHERPANDENLIRSTAPSRDKMSRLPAPPTKGPMRFSMSYRSSPIPNKGASVSPRSVNVSTTEVSRKPSRPKSRPVSQPPRGRTATSRSTSPVPPKKARVELPATKYGKTNVDVEIFLPKPHNEEEEREEKGEGLTVPTQSKDIKVEIFMPRGMQEAPEEKHKETPSEASQILSADGVTPVAKPNNRTDLLQSGCRSEILGGESGSRVVDDEEEETKGKAVLTSAKETPERCQRSAILLPPKGDTQRSFILDDAQVTASGLPKPPPPSPLVPSSEDEVTPKRLNNEFPLPRFSVRTPGALFEAFARAVPSPVQQHTPVREGEFQTPLPVTRMTLTPPLSTVAQDGSNPSVEQPPAVEKDVSGRDASPVPTPAKVVDSIHASAEKRCCSRPSPAKWSKSAVTDDGASHKRSRSFNSPLPTTDNLIQSVQASADRRPCGCARPTPKSPSASQSTGRSPAVHFHGEEGTTTSPSSPPHVRRCCDRPTPASISVSEAAVPKVSKSICSPSPWPSTDNIVSSIAVEKRDISGAVSGVNVSAEPREQQVLTMEEEQEEEEGSPVVNPGHVLASVQKEGTTRKLSPPASARTPSPAFTDKEIADSVLASAEKRRCGRPNRDSNEPSSKPPVQVEAPTVTSARTPSPVPDKGKLIESLETSARKQANPDREESPKPVHHEVPFSRPPPFKTASPIPTQDNVDTSVLASADKRKKVVSEDASAGSATVMAPPNDLSATDHNFGSPKLMPQHIASSLRIIEEVLDCERSGAMEPVSVQRMSDFSSPVPVPQPKDGQEKNDLKGSAETAAPKRSGAMERDGTFEKGMDVFASPSPMPTKEDEEEEGNETPNKAAPSSDEEKRSAAVQRTSASAFPDPTEAEADSNFSPAPEPQRFVEDEEQEQKGDQAHRDDAKRSGAMERPSPTALQTEEVDFASPTVTLKEVAQSEEVIQMEEATESRSERRPRATGADDNLDATVVQKAAEQNSSPTFSDICQPSDMFQDCVSAPPTPQVLPLQFYQLQRDVKAISEGRASRPAPQKTEKQPAQVDLPLARQSTILGTGDVAAEPFRPNDIQHPHEPIEQQANDGEAEEEAPVQVSLTPLPSHRTGVVTTSAIVDNECLPRPVTLSSQMEAYVARRSAEKAASTSMHHASVSPRVRSFSKGASRSPPPPTTTSYKRESFEPNLKDDDRVFESSPDASSASLQDTPPPKEPVTRSPSKEETATQSGSNAESPNEPSRRRGRRSQLEQLMDMLPASVAEEVRRSDTLLSSDSLLQGESEEAMGTPGRLSAGSQNSISARVTERSREKYFDYKAYEKYLNEMNRPVSKKSKKLAKKRAKKEQRQKQAAATAAAAATKEVETVVEAPKKKAQISSPKCRLVRPETGPWNYVSTTELSDELEEAIFKYPHHTTPKSSTLGAHTAKAKKAAHKKAHKAKPVSPKKTSPAKSSPSKKTAAKAPSNSISSKKKSSPFPSPLSSSSSTSSGKAKLKLTKKQHLPGKSKKLRKFKDKRR